jgi:flagellar biosynthesis protein FlhG
MTGTTAPLFPEHQGPPRVWAVGGGKGGVGKTVVTSSLAIALARTGLRVAVVDADLGGANLHTVLGIPHPKRSLTDFLSREVSHLGEVLTPTHTPNLWLVSGAGAMMDMANIKHAQKEKIIRKLATLPVDFILLDLGAGSTFNTIDFFLSADQGILVVVPEPTSIENAYHFLKSSFYRRLKRATRLEGVAETIDRVMHQKLWRGIRTPHDLVEAVNAENSEAGAALMRETACFTPYLIVNEARRADDRFLGPEICSACATYFGIVVHFLGATDHDDRVTEALRLKKAPLELHPGCAFARAVHDIARKVAAAAPPAGGTAGAESAAGGQAGAAPAAGGHDGR